MFVLYSYIWFVDLRIWCYYNLCVLLCNGVEIVVKNEEVYYSLIFLNNVYYYICIFDDCLIFRVLINKF